MAGLRQSLYQEYAGFPFWVRRERSLTAYAASPQLGDLIFVDMFQVYKEDGGMASALFDYITTTYGKETRLEFVQQLGQHIGWGTLIAAVFGVSAAEFEAERQAYLAATYLPSERDAEVGE